MLRITILNSSTEQKFVVEGKLTEPWATELESAWQRGREARSGRKCVVDLSDTTVIDPRGRSLLMVMCSEGAQFVGKGVATMHLIKDLQRECARRLLNTTLESP